MGEDEMVDINMRQSQRDKGKIEIMYIFFLEVILIFSYMQMFMYYLFVNLDY